jgi:hypothetical protein
MIRAALKARFKHDVVGRARPVSGARECLIKRTIILRMLHLVAELMARLFSS